MGIVPHDLLMEILALLEVTAPATGIVMVVLLAGIVPRTVTAHTVIRPLVVIVPVTVIVTEVLLVVIDLLMGTAMAAPLVEIVHRTVTARSAILRPAGTVPPIVTSLRVPPMVTVGSVPVRPKTHALVRAVNVPSAFVVASSKI